MSGLLGGPLFQVGGRWNAFDPSGQSWTEGEWWQQLSPGSWRGVGFVMDIAETRAGRRVAIHEYPYRDTAWVEDLGRLPPRFAIQAFLVGDDVYAQRDAMVDACEVPGPGTLVHPTIGALECVLLDFAVTDRRDHGRVVEIVMQFLRATDASMPGLTLATGASVTGAIAQLGVAAAADLARALFALPSVPRAATQIGGFTAQALGAVNDAGRALQAVRGLPGYYGRYAGGRRSTLLPAAATVPSVLRNACTSRSAVVSASNALTLAASLL